MKKKKQYVTLFNRRNQDKTIGLILSNGNTSKKKDLISSNSMQLVMQVKKKYWKYLRLEYLY
jgi:hypothetical protein